MTGNVSPFLSATKYGANSAFFGSSSVTALNCISVPAGHELLINFTDSVISLAVSWPMGCCVTEVFLPPTKGRDCGSCMVGDCRVG